MGRTIVAVENLRRLILIGSACKVTNSSGRFIIVPGEWQIFIFTVIIDRILQRLLIRIIILFGAAAVFAGTDGTKQEFRRFCTLLFEKLPDGIIGNIRNGIISKAAVCSYNTVGKVECFHDIFYLIALTEADKQIALKQKGKTAGMKGICKYAVCIFQIAKPFFDADVKTEDVLDIGILLEAPVFYRNIRNFYNFKMMKSCIIYGLFNRNSCFFHDIVEQKVMLLLWLCQD